MHAIILVLAAMVPADAPKPKLSDSERGLLQHARDELKSQVPARRQAAAEALAEVGPRMRDAIPELWDALLDPKPKVREAVGNALLKVDPEFGGLVSSLALNSNINALRNVSKLGASAPKLKPILLDVIARLAPNVRLDSRPRIGPSIKEVLAKFNGNALVECLRTLRGLLKEDDRELFRTTIYLMGFEGSEYVCQGRTQKESCEDVRVEAVTVFRGLKRPAIPPRPKPPVDPKRPTLDEVARQNEWFQRRKSIVGEPSQALALVVCRDGPATRRAAFQTLKVFADTEAKNDVAAALEREAKQMKVSDVVNKEIAEFLRRLK